MNATRARHMGPAMVYSSWRRTAVKTFLLLAAVASAAAGKTSTATSFNAVIRPDESQAVSNVNGVANFKIDNDAVRYEVQLAALKQVTDVVLLADSKTIRLYGGPATSRDGLQAGGILTSADLQGLSVSQLASVMESGQARVVVFTVRKPDGSIGGKVVPVPGSELPLAPAPKTTA